MMSMRTILALILVSLGFTMAANVISVVMVGDGSGALAYASSISTMQPFVWNSAWVAITTGQGGFAIAPDGTNSYWSGAGEQQSFRSIDTTNQTSIAFSLGTGFSNTTIGRAQQRWLLGTNNMNFRLMSSANGMAYSANQQGNTFTSSVNAIINLMTFSRWLAVGGLSPNWCNYAMDTAGLLQWNNCSDDVIFGCIGGRARDVAVNPHNESQLLVVGEGCVNHWGTSSDGGLTWSFLESIIGVSGMNSVAYGNGFFIVIAYDVVPMIFRVDPITFETYALTVPGSAFTEINDVAYVYNLGVWIIAGATIGQKGYAASSNDLTNWDIYQSSVCCSGLAQFDGPIRAIAVRNPPALLTSISAMTNLTGDMLVTSPVSVTANLTIAGDLMINDDFNISSDASIVVIGSITLNSTLVVYQGSSLTASGDLIAGPGAVVTPGITTKPVGSTIVTIPIATFSSSSGSFSAGSSIISFEGSECYSSSLPQLNNNGNALSATVIISLVPSCSNSGLPTAALIGIIVGVTVISLAVVLSIVCVARLNRSERRAFEAGYRLMEDREIQLKAMSSSH